MRSCGGKSQRKTSPGIRESIKKRPLPRIGRGRFILTLVFRWGRPRSINHRNRNQRLRNHSSTRSRSWLRNRTTGHSSDGDGTSGRGSRGCSSDGACSKARSSTNHNRTRLRSHSWLRNRTRLRRRNHSSAQRRSWPLRHSHSWLRNRSWLRSSKVRSSSCCDVGTSGTSSNRRRRSPTHNHTPAHNNHGDGRRTRKRYRHTTRQRPGSAPQQQNEGSSHDSYRYSNGGGKHTWVHGAKQARRKSAPTRGKCEATTATPDRCDRMAHNVGFVITRYRQPSLASLTDPSDLTERTREKVRSGTVVRVVGSSPEVGESWGWKAVAGPRASLSGCCFRRCVEWLGRIRSGAWRMQRR